MGQETILKLRSALGHSGLDIFSASKEGICRGVAQTSINAFVLEKALEKEALEKRDTSERKNEFQQYLDRIDFILKHHSNLPRLISNTYQTIKERTARLKPILNGQSEISNDELKILDVAAIIESMQLFAYPDKYSEIFGKHLTQQDIVEISYYAQPLELEKRSIPIQQRDMDIKRGNENLDEIKKQSGIIKTDGISGIYTPDELINYIAILTNLVEKHPCDLALAIDNDEHAISVFYDTSTKTWTMIDAEHLSTRAVSPMELAQRISRQLPNIWDPTKVFNMKFFTSVNRKKEVENFVTELKCQKEFIILHKVTAERAQLADQKGVTLAYLAASEGDIPVLMELTKLKNEDSELVIDFNKPIKDGTTPLSMAIQNGCAVAVKLLAGLCKPEGTPAIDFNKLVKTKHGTWTPLYLAAQHDQENIIKILSELRNSDGMFLIDFNQAVDGIPPAFAAAQYGCANAFKTLLELRNPNGTRVIDVNKSVYYGNTYLDIAIKQGHANIVRNLAELRNPDDSNTVNLNKTTSDGQTAIHITTTENQLSILKILAEYKNSDSSPLVDFNKKDRDGYNIIHRAAQKGYVDIMVFLLTTQSTTGIDFNAINNEGLTVAHVAAANNQVNVLKILEKHGIDIYIQAANKKPIDLARNSDVFNFYKAIDKRKKLLTDLELIKGVNLSIQQFDSIKANILDSFYNDHEKFLDSNEFEKQIDFLLQSTEQSQNIYGFFAVTDENMNQQIAGQKDHSKSAYLFEMVTDINDNLIEIAFKSSLAIKFEKTSPDPVIWELSLTNDFEKSLSIPINDKDLIEKLIEAFSNKDLQSCVDLLKEKKGRSFRKITKRIESELDMQKYEQDNHLSLS